MVARLIQRSTPQGELVTVLKYILFYCHGIFIIGSDTPVMMPVKRQQRLTKKILRGTQSSEVTGLARFDVSVGDPSSIHKARFTHHHKRIFLDG